MIMQGKRVLVTGVLDESSIAFAVARLAQEQGADVILTSYGRVERLTRRVAKRLPTEPEVLELDVTNPAHAESLRRQLADRWCGVDAVLHAIAFGPPGCFADSFLGATWDDVATAMHVSAYSLKVLGEIAAPLMKARGGSIVGLDFDASQACPVYNWMGVAKSALEATARYLARELGPTGVRVNLVAAGPLRTFSARPMTSGGGVSDLWAGRAPLGWSTDDPVPVARACVALMSDWFPATTGEIVHVDGGFHSQAF